MSAASQAAWPLLLDRSALTDEVFEARDRHISISVCVSWLTLISVRFISTRLSRSAPILSAAGPWGWGWITQCSPCPATRPAVLDWYRRNAGRWATDVRVADAEALVDAALAKPPTLPATIARSAGARTQRLTLTRIEAHRFSGLHAYGPSTAHRPSLSTSRAPR